MELSDNWKILNKLKIVTIVCVASRPGSDLIQSLFDSHPQVISIDGDLDFNEFYMNAYSIWGTNLKFNIRNEIENIDIKDLLLEFVYKNIDKFKSQYDNLDNKKATNTEIEKFIEYGEHLMNEVEFKPKNLFLAIYGAYNLARGNDLESKTYLLHHAHTLEKLNFLNKEFDTFKIIAANRDPRSSYLSILSALNKHNAGKIGNPTHNYIISRLFHGRDHLSRTSNQDIRISCLEDLHKDSKIYLSSICNWLNIKENNSLFQSSWNNIAWFGDSMSENINSTFNKDFHRNSTINWKKKLNIVDKIIISSLNRDEIKFYKYDLSYTSPFFLILTFILILIPNKIEIINVKRYISKLDIPNLLKSLYYLLERYYIMYMRFFLITFKINKKINKI
jgi:hypothetical protein